MLRAGHEVSQLRRTFTRSATGLACLALAGALVVVGKQTGIDTSTGQITLDTTEHGIHRDELPPTNRWSTSVIEAALGPGLPLSAAGLPAASPRVPRLREREIASLHDGVLHGPERRRGPR